MAKKTLIKEVDPRLASLVKLNIFSAISGFLFFIAIESGLNIYRVERLTGLSFSTLKNIYFLFYFIGFALSTIILHRLLQKWKTSLLSGLLLAVLWFPYFYLFIRIFKVLLPFTYHGDVPSAGTGFIVILGILLYPFYLIVINLLTGKSQNTF